MTKAEIDTFLSEVRHLQVATNGADGYPHLTTLWFVLDDGWVVFRSFTKSQRIVNLRRDPRVTALAESGATYEELKGVMIQGVAHLDSAPDAVIEVNRRVMEKMAGHPVDGETAQALFGRHAGKNTVVRIEPVKVASWDHSRLEGMY